MAEVVTEVMGRRSPAKLEATPIRGGSPSEASCRSVIGNDKLQNARKEKSAEQLCWLRVGSAFV